jgi:hypothetical protein
MNIRERRRRKKKRSVNETSTCHQVVELYKVLLLLPLFGKRTNIDARDSFVSFLCEQKIGQGSIYDQQMSERIFVTNCSFERRKRIEPIENSHHHQQHHRHPFQASWYYYIMQLRKKKKGKSYSTTFDLCLIIERLAG